jgi:hypothetical protein
MFKTVLLAADLTSESSWRKALPVALAQCEAFGAKLHIVNGWCQFNANLSPITGKRQVHAAS